MFESIFYLILAGILYLYRPGNWLSYYNINPEEYLGEDSVSSGRRRLDDHLIDTLIGKYTYTQIWTASICYFGILLIFLELVLAFVILFADKHTLEYSRFKRQFGYFYESLKSDSKWARFFNVSFILRRLF